jgi:hypothetical protein
MTYEELQNSVIEWASEKGILEKSNPIRQLEKTQEELDETMRALIFLDSVQLGSELSSEFPLGVDYWMDEAKDGIGDMLVTIIILARLLNLNSVDCLNAAYNVIKNRTGQMINGQFVKDCVDI